MPGDTTTKSQHTNNKRKSGGKKDKFSYSVGTSASAKPNSASHPLVEECSYGEESQQSNTLGNQACLAQPDCQSTSNVNVPLTATVRLSVAGWGP